MSILNLYTYQLVAVATFVRAEINVGNGKYVFYATQSTIRLRASFLCEMDNNETIAPRIPHNNQRNHSNAWIAAAFGCSGMHSITLNKYFGVVIEVLLVRGHNH